jgi:hypothetical protein
MSNKGFDPNSNNKPQTPPQQPTGPASLGSDDRAFRAQVAAEIAQLRNQVNGALTARAQGIQAVADEYQEASQRVADQASELLYDVLSGGSFFNQIARNVGQLMAAHPTGEKLTIQTPTLRPISYQPLPQATPRASLTATADSSNTK